MLHKKELRTEYLAQRRGLEPEFVRTHSEALRQNLALFLRENPAELVIGYASIDNEPNILPFLDDFEQKTALFRIIEGQLEPHYIAHTSELEEGPYGIKQPKTTADPVKVNEHCSILIPGVVFSRSGDRIGYGKGYFDRFLVTKQVRKIGICYDFQLQDAIPAEPHDIRMDIIITPSTIISIS